MFLQCSGAFPCGLLCPKSFAVGCESLLLVILVLASSRGKAADGYFQKSVKTTKKVVILLVFLLPQREIYLPVLSCLTKSEFSGVDKVCCVFARCLAQQRSISSLVPGQIMAAPPPLLPEGLRCLTATSHSSGEFVLFQKFLLKTTDIFFFPPHSWWLSVVCERSALVWSGSDCVNNVK